MRTLYISLVAIFLLAGLSAAEESPEPNSAPAADCVPLAWSAMSPKEKGSPPNAALYENPIPLWTPWSDWWRDPHWKPWDWIPEPPGWPLPEPDPDPLDPKPSVA